jgi:hypothetical protein
MLSHRGVDSVGTDQDFYIFSLAVREMQADMVRLAFDSIDRSTESHRALRHR